MLFDRSLNLPDTRATHAARSRQRSRWDRGQASGALPALRAASSRPWPTLSPPIGWSSARLHSPAAA